MAVFSKCQPTVYQIALECCYPLEYFKHAVQINLSLYCYKWKHLYLLPVVVGYQCNWDFVKKEEKEINK